MNTRNHISTVVLFCMLVLSACAPSAESTEAWAPMLTTTDNPEPVATRTVPLIPATATFTPSPLLPTATSLPTAKPTSPSTCGPYQDVNVKFGTYDCARYTAAEGNFSCNLSQIPSHVSIFSGYDYVEDFQIDAWNGGGFYAQHLESYYVEYFSRSRLRDDMKSLLENPSTQKQALEQIFENLLLLAREADNPQVEVIRKEYLENGLLLVELYSRPAELQVFQEATYIFASEEFFYFVTYEAPRMTYESVADLDKKRLASTELQSRLEDLYTTCEFSQ